uniref:LIM/homeobox protein Lhx9 n=1 Tax=Oryzias latipes TaxID=8090 RepID=A0A3P9IGE4_ORYLA
NSGHLDLAVESQENSFLPLKVSFDPLIPKVFLNTFSVSIRDPMVCAGCGELVCDRFFLLAAGRVWHGACLRCSLCHCELQTHASLYWRDGNIYCQQDYCRIFGGGQCARCFQPIPPSALVMRSGDLTFHPQCFSCQVGPNLHFCLFTGANLYCEFNYLHIKHNQTPPSSYNLIIGGPPPMVAVWNSVSSPEPRLDDKAGGGRSRRRSKRIRTCFRREQLRALESYFAQKHNPDGKDWTCLAHKTGLPKRVLQVNMQLYIQQKWQKSRGRSLFVCLKGK